MMQYKIQQSIIYLLLVLGVLGNSATLVILKFEKGLRTFTKMIFALQAVADLMWVTWQAINKVYGSLQPNHSRLIDRLIFFMTNTSACCSLWCVDVIALERMCLVMWPTNPIIRRAAFKEAVIACFSLLLFSAALSALEMFCFNYKGAWQLVLWYILFNFSPLFISFISSAVFLYKIKTNTRRINPDQQNQLNQPSVLPIKIVAAASTFSFVLLMPLTCLNIRIAYYKFPNPVQELVELNIYYWFQKIWFTNFSLKFFLYTIFIRHFRKGFVDICKKVKNKFIRN